MHTLRLVTGQFHPALLVGLIAMLLVGCSIESPLNPKAASKDRREAKIETSDVMRTPTGQDCFGIIHGKEAPEQPGILKLTSPSQCTMSLLSPDVVMTAAHCIQRKTDSIAIMGHGTFRVEAIKNHGLFGEDGAEILADPNNIQRDLALLKISPSITGVAPIQLAPADAMAQPDDEVTMLGYGLTQFTEQDGTFAQTGVTTNRLMAGTNGLLASVGAAHYVGATANAAGGGMGAAGDSGGPLMWRGKMIGVMHKGTMNFRAAGLATALLVDDVFLARIDAQTPQFLGVWVNLQDEQVRTFLQEAKDEGFEWSMGQTELPPVIEVDPPVMEEANDSTVSPLGEHYKDRTDSADDGVACAATSADDIYYESDTVDLGGTVDNRELGEEASDQPPLDETNDANEVAADTALDSELVARYVEKMNAIRSQATTCGDEVMPQAAPLTWNEKLYRAALRHSQDLSDNNIGGHQGSDGSFPNHRVADAGYAFFSVGENVATGFFDLDRVYAAWQDSPGHCKNNMASYYSEFALARVDGVWTLVFGRPKN